MQPLTDIQLKEFKEDFLFRGSSYLDLVIKYDITESDVLQRTSIVLDEYSKENQLNKAKGSPIPEEQLLCTKRFFESPQVTIGDLKKMEDPDQFLREYYT